MQQLSRMPTEVPLRRFRITGQQAVVIQQNRNEEAERKGVSPPWPISHVDPNFALMEPEPAPKSATSILVGLLVVIGVVVVAAGVSGQRADDRRRSR